MRSRSNHLLCFVVLCAAALTGVAVARADTALQSGCEFLSDWQAVKEAQPAQFAHIADFNVYMDTYRAAQERSAHSFYLAYRSGQVSGSALGDCVASDSDRSDFDELLPRVFLAASLEELHAKAVASESRKFLEIIERRKAAGLLNAFRLIAHHDESNPTGNPGGFHRANHSIFMDLGLIRGDQWLLVLSHELAHAVDADLAASLPVYNNEATVAQLAQWGHQFDDPSSLPAAELSVLDTWLIAGLNRGLLTEARAWSVTVAVYREGLSSGLFAPIDWMESLFGALQSPQGELMPTLAVLSPRFVDPVDGLFALPLIQKRLKWVRQGLLDGGIGFEGIR